MEIIRKVRNRILSYATNWAHSGGLWRQTMYYRILDVSFIREQKAVGAGIAEYKRQMGTGEELYLLRRDIHRLEKALTMRPLRKEFALDYIQETLDAYDAVVTGVTGTVWLQGEEYKWATSVLAEYFEATRESQNPLIQKAERSFQSLQPGPNASACEHGPLHPPDEAPPVQYDDLLALAERRRSVRWYEDRAVDRRLVDNAVRVAQEAPTACNRQPYKFYIFDDHESIQRIAEIPMGTAGFRHQIPGIIVVVGDLSAFFDSRDRHLIYVDACLATMGLLHGLESQGVSSCSVNWPDMPEREQAMKKLLGLKDYERVIMLVTYGYPQLDALAPYSAKKSLDDAREFRDLNSTPLR